VIPGVGGGGTLPSTREMGYSESHGSGTDLGFPIAGIGEMNGF
jgi:hypothetical protein